MICSPGYVVGQLSCNWHDIQSNVSIRVGLGDLQCSILATHARSMDAGNLFTSSPLLRRCYTICNLMRYVYTAQRCLQVETCLAVSVEAEIYFEIASFYWLLDRYNARQVARRVLHCAMAKNALQRRGHRCRKSLLFNLSHFNLILLRAMLLATKWSRDFMIAGHITPYNFACNLCRKTPCVVTTLCVTAPFLDVAFESNFIRGIC